MTTYIATAADGHRFTRKSDEVITHAVLMQLKDNSWTARFFTSSAAAMEAGEDSIEMWGAVILNIRVVHANPVSAKYPEITVRLEGATNTRTAIAVGIRRQALEAGLSKAEAAEYFTEATQGTMEDLLAATEQWFTVA